MISDDGVFAIDVPRDRNSEFEPQSIKKHQTRFTGMNDKIFCLYAKAMTTWEIVANFQEMWDAVGQARTQCGRNEKTYLTGALPETLQNNYTMG